MSEWVRVRVRGSGFRVRGSGFGVQGVSGVCNSCSPKRPVRPNAALMAVNRAMVTKGPIDPKIDGGTALGALSHAWSGSFFIAMST